MCGIAGFLDLERRSGSQELEALGRAMAARLNHRGPDAHGLWADAEAGVVLGHTRLSIVDLSPAGVNANDLMPSMATFSAHGGQSTEGRVFVNGVSVNGPFGGTLFHELAMLSCEASKEGEPTVVVVSTTPAPACRPARFGGGGERSSSSASRKNGVTPHSDRTAAPEGTQYAGPTGRVAWRAAKLVVVAAAV